MDNMENTGDDESLSGVMNPDLNIEFTKLQLRELEVQRREIQFQKKLLLLNCGKKETNTLANRTVTADGKIIFKNTVDRPDTAADATFSGAGDSKDACSCQAKTWNEQATSEDSSTPSTCVVYSEDRSVRERKAKSDMTTFDKSDISDKIVKSVDFINKTDRPKSRCTEISKVSRKSDYSRFTEKSDVTSKKEVCKNVAKKSEISCDLKFDCDDENEDETNRMIQLRNADYMDIVDENLKIVIALAGYPKSKMRLKQMEIFQRSINDIMDMQLKQGLVKKTPLFLDYYLNRGAIVCICKDVETRDWMIRVSPGLQERMSNNLLLLKAKVKRLCVAVMKIPQSCWPSSAQDVFKLLQYFNPTLLTDQWKIYAQKVVNNVECTSFLIDRISGEIIRGPTFRNIIDYSQMDFELTGFTEIYYDCFLSNMEEDLHSVASRVKLLEVIRSTDTTPRTEKYQSEKSFKSITNDLKEDDNEMSAQDVADAMYNERVDSAIDMEAEDVEFSEPKETIVNKQPKTKERKSKGIEEPWCLQTNCEEVQSKSQEDTVNNYEPSTPALSDKSESVFASSDNLVLSRSSNLNIDSNRGIAYHRRTNYLHVENELKIAITLQGYPQEKLEGNHIRRFKHLFKEYIHKDMKVHRFDNMIIPKFQDVYLSNGAVIYVCDSLETKDYLSEVLPKFVNSTGLKLIFREVQNLLRYTRLVMRLSKELAHVESLEILRNLQSRYPKLKPECWKYYSDVAGKQKRQFGVDPESLEIIKSPDFDPTYEGETLVFRIIDRQKKEKNDNIKEPVICTEDKEKKKLRETITQNMYCPIHVANSSLTRIRANHYSDLVPDDLKLYVGPSNYPETRIDESVFQKISRNFEDILVSKGEVDFDFPKIHDMYLFDGVIFIICKNLSSRSWIAESLSQVNQKGNINLKATEFRGAVGIVSLYLNAGKDADYVVSTLQKQNPRLRTKYWRKINTVRTKSKLDIVLQIDKLSAQVIMNKGFNGNIDNNEVTFKLGHLKSLINRKLCLDVPKSPSNKSAVSKKSVSQGGSRSPELHVDQPELNQPIDRLKTRESEVFFSAHVDIKSDSDKSIYSVPKASKHSYCKLNLRVPSAILPDHKDGLEMIFDLLQDKNPGLNTELWKVQSRYGRGAFKLMIDKQSASVIQSKEFDPTVGGEKLKFSLLKVPGLQRACQPFCLACGGRGELYCAGCGVAPYCSPTCQRYDWVKRHRTVCHNLARTPDQLEVNHGEKEEPIHSDSKEITRNNPKNQRLQTQVDLDWSGNTGSNKNDKLFEKKPQIGTRPSVPTTGPLRRPKFYNSDKFELQTDKPVPPEINGTEKLNVVKAPAVDRKQNFRPEIGINDSQKSNGNVAQTSTSTKGEAVQTGDISEKVQGPRATPNAQNSVQSPKEQVHKEKTQTAPVAIPKIQILPKTYIVATFEVGEKFLLSVGADAKDCLLKQEGVICIALNIGCDDNYKVLCNDYCLLSNAEPDTYTPKPGELFSYNNREDVDLWFRARCLNSTSAALIDACQIVSYAAGVCKKIPSNYQDIPEFCCVLDADVSIGDQLSATIITKLSCESVRVDLQNDTTHEKLGHATISRWSPAIELPIPSGQSIPQVARPSIKNNSRVILIEALKLDALYIRSADSKTTRHFNGVIHDAILCAQEGTPLKEPPTRGQVVIAKYKDGIFSRALVQRVNTLKAKYLLEYIEWGYVEIQTLDTLYPCPDNLSLENQPTVVSRVKVATEYPDITEPAKEYINKVRDQGFELVLTLADAETAPSGSEVRLTLEKNKENFNRQVIEMCKPNWKLMEQIGIDVVEVPPIMYYDIDFVSVPSGCEFIVLDVGGLIDGVLSGYPADTPRASFILDNLTDLMAAYCNSALGRDPYLPLTNELCIAQLPPHEEWFRAVMLEQVNGAGGTAAKVAFIDYGNIATVPVSVLRKMLPEFVQDISGLASSVQIRDFPSSLTDIMVERALEYLQLDDMDRGRLTIKNCKKIGTNIYDVDAPGLIAIMKGKI